MNNPDPTRFNHYVPTDAWRVAEKYGTNAVALCGYTWVPTGFDHRKSLCPTCEERAGMTESTG